MLLVTQALQGGFQRFEWAEEIAEQEDDFAPSHATDRIRQTGPHVGLFDHLRLIQMLRDAQNLAERITGWQETSHTIVKGRQ